MERKIAVLFLILMSLLMLTACSGDKKEYEVYGDDYISFNYPANLDILVNEFDNNKQILLEKDSDFQFVIEIKVAEENTMRKTAIEDFQEAYVRMLENVISTEVISYEETTLGGETAKELRLRVKVLDTAIEQLYNTLNTEMASEKEVRAFLDQHGEGEAFIREMKSNPEKLEELKAILLQLEAVNEEKKLSIRIANSYIDNINYLIREKMDIVYQQKVLVGHKENVRVDVFFQSTEKEYEDKIEDIQRIIDSIEFVN